MEKTDIAHRLRDWRNLHLTLGGKLFEEAADEIERLRNGAVTGRETVRLTDAEREAIELFATLEWTSMRWSKVEKNAATLRKLLERLA